jgi:hypothetical protein
MPSTDKMIQELPKLVNGNATSVLVPAIEACGIEIKNARAKFTGKHLRAYNSMLISIDTFPENSSTFVNFL